VQFLCEQVDGLVWRASGPSLLAWCLEHPISSAAAPSVEALVATLRLPPLQEIVLCFGLAVAASRPDIRREKTGGACFCDGGGGGWHLRVNISF
jgi:hypothetical protein